MVKMEVDDTASTALRTAETTDTMQLDQTPSEQSRALTAAHASHSSSTIKVEAVEADQKLSAAHRALHTPELLLPILRHLKRDQVDLISCSLVSRFFRQAAIIHLLKDFDLPLSKIKRVLASFRSREAVGLLQHIKRLRIWDDEAHARFRRESYGSDDPPNYPAAGPWRKKDKIDFFDDVDNSEFDPRWQTGVLWFLKLITVSRKGPLPLIDLSLGVISSKAVCRALAAFPQAAARVCAVRVISDYFEDSDLFNVDDSRPIEDLNTCSRQWWASLEMLIRIVCSVQDKAPSSNFRVFAIEASRSFVDIRVPGDTAVFQKMADLLCNRIEDLTIHGSPYDMTLFSFANLLQANWTKLRRVSLSRIREDIPVHEHGAEQVIDEFLDRHLHLKEIHIWAPMSADGLGDISFRQTFPNLKRFVVQTGPFATMHAFLSRHPQLEYLGTECMRPINDPLELIIGEGHLPNLKAYRVIYGGSQHLVYSDPRIAQLELFERRSIDEVTGYFDAGVNTFPPRPYITCLVFSVTNERLDDIISHLGAQLHHAQFPNLAELVIRSTWDWNGRRSDPETASQLKRLLASLRSAVRLRVLHVHCPGVGALPKVSPLNSTIDALPPSLEYLAWHDSTTNQTQFYRVIPKKTVAWGQYHKYLQLLPASSRSRVVGDGVWNQDSDLQSAKVFMDHTCSPPAFYA